MERIKRYKVKDSITKEYLLKKGFSNDGGTWIHKENKLYKTKYIRITNKVEYKTKDGKTETRKYMSEFDIEIVFDHDINIWDDSNNVLVINDSCGQPYYPFYDYLDGKMKHNEIPEILALFVTEYNKYMDSLEFLEEVKDGV